MSKRKRKRTVKTSTVEIGMWSRPGFRRVEPLSSPLAGTLDYDQLGRHRHTLNELRDRRKGYVTY
jgi:hypothetical protein